MKKQLLLFLFAIVASVGTMFAEKVQIGNLYYNLDATNQTAKVTYESEWSSENYKDLTTANIPASVTYNSKTYSVTRIEAYAFDGCSSLTSVTIGNSVTSIGDYAFEDCTGLTSITIPNSVTSIGSSAFAFCSSLTSVTIPNSVTSIGGWAFRYCYRLTSVTIGNSVTSIGWEAFKGCSNITIVVWNAKNCNSYNFGSQVTSFEFGNEVEVIPSSLCEGMTNLTSVTIPNSVTSIESIAFKDCTGLTSVTIPNSVTSIENAAFSGCSSLTSINVVTDNLNYCSVEGVLFNKDKTVLVQCPGGKEGDYTIPNSVTSIGERAFYGCSGLTSVTIPNSVTSIGSYAFEDCSGLTSVTIPNSVTSIGMGVFSGCTGLTSVTLGTSIKEIRYGTFDGCTAIETITCYSMRPPTANQDALYGLDYSTIVYVPADYLNNYKMHDLWGLYDVRPLGAKNTETTDVNVTPAENTAEVAWPAVSGAATYELVIKDKSGNVICTLVFNANGQLTQIAFNAPSRNNAPQQTQAAGFSFTVTGLEEGTSYDLTITSKDNNGGTLDTKTVSFTTTGDEQGIDEVPSDQVQSTKILRDGKMYIIRGEKVYNAQGALVK